MSELLVVVRDPLALDDFYRALRDAGQSVLITGRSSVFSLCPDVAYALVLGRGRPTTHELDIVTTLSRRHGHVVILATDEDPGLTSAEPDGAERGAPAAHRGVTAALDMIAKQYSHARCSARTIAHTVGVSEEYLCRLVKARTGRTIGALVHDARLREARRLLVATAFSVKEIAQLVGYSGAGHLTRRFRRSFRTTPVAFRHAAAPSRTGDEISKSADAW